ncbi:MAG: hypothetical protein OXE44_13040 [Nitrospinae bacterium]|nr:hypothetical protein [Nitrospinota bacterium]
MSDEPIDFRDDIFSLMLGLCSIVGGYLENDPNKLSTLCHVLKKSALPENMAGTIESRVENILRTIASKDPKGKLLLQRILERMQDDGYLDKISDRYKEDDS